MLNSVQDGAISAWSGWSRLTAGALIVVLGASLGALTSVLAQELSPQFIVLILAGLIGGAVVLLLLKRLSVLISLVLFYAPVELFVQKWLPDSVGSASRYASEGLLIVAFIALLLDRMRAGKPWKRTPLDIPLLLFVGVGILSAVVNRIPILVAGLGFRILLRYVLLFYLIIQIGYTHEAARKLIRAILFLASIVIGIGFLQALIGPPITRILHVEETRIGEQTLRTISGVLTARGRYIFSTLGRYDALGVYLTVIFLLALALYYYYPIYRRKLGCFVVATGVCLLLTMSRQSWVAIYVALWTWGLIARKKRFVNLMVLLLAISGVIFLMINVAPHLVRYFSTQELGQATILTRILEPFSRDYFEVSAYRGGRFFTLRFIGGRILELSPWLGFGPGRFGSITATYFGFSTADLLGVEPWQVHFADDVNWITILGQYGLLGVITFLSMFWVLFRYACRIYRRPMHRRSPEVLTKSIALTCIGCIPVLVLLGFLGPNFEQRAVAMYFWTIMGLLVALARADSTAPAGTA